MAQLRCTVQLAPPARSSAHNFSALARVSAPTWTRAQPMLPRASPWCKTRGSRPPRMGAYFSCRRRYAASAVASDELPTNCTPQDPEVSLRGPAGGGQGQRFADRHGGCEVHLSRPRLNPSPLLGGVPRYDPHIRVGLPRYATPASKPIANPSGSGIVGGCREPEVSKARAADRARALRIGQSLRLDQRGPQDRASSPSLA